MSLWVVCLVALLGTVNCAPKEVGWWKNAVIYEIYPRSFFSANNNQNGTGDLNGIISKVDYIKSLGVDAVWMNPIYPALSNADAGYDISDFKNVDPQFGTLDDFKKLVKTFNDKGMKVIVDYVPNHTSNLHEWFLKSVRREDKYTDYYMWVDPPANNKSVPPNNWMAVMAGPAWEWNEDRKQFYLHQYLTEQVDLNYTNPNVLQEMKDVLTFWMDLGVDGFRMDAVSAISEDNRLLDEPLQPGKQKAENYGDLVHIYTQDLPGTYKVLREFRKTLDDYAESKNAVEKIMFTESYVQDMDKVLQYYGTEKEPIAHFPFNFFLIQNISRESKPEDYKRVIDTWFQYIDPNKYWPNWVIGNHDQHRMSSRFSPEHADLIQMIMMILKGTTLIFAGDEIALEDSFVRFDEAQDPQGTRNPPAEFQSHTRDPQRGPIPWDDSDNGGFSKTKPWLPLTSKMDVNVKSQLNANKSHISVIKKLIKLKKLSTVVLGNTQVEPLGCKNNKEAVLIITRSLADHPTIMAVLNLNAVPCEIDLKDYRKSLPDKINLYVSSVNSGFKDGNLIDTNSIRFNPVTGVILTSGSLEQNNL